MKIGPRTRVGAPCRRGSLAPGFPPPESLLTLERGKVRNPKHFPTNISIFIKISYLSRSQKRKKPTCRLIGRFCPRVPELRLPQGLRCSSIFFVYFFPIFLTLKLLAFLLNSRRKNIAESGKSRIIREIIISLTIKNFRTCRFS